MKCLGGGFFLCLFLLTDLVLNTAAAGAQGPGPAARVVNRIEETRLAALPAARHPLANRANDQGAVADATPLGRVHLALKRSPEQESSLRQLLGDMHTPGSARYHKWLSAEEFGRQFGPADADVAAVEGWLAGRGFGSVRVLPGRQAVEFSGTAAQFREAFHSEIHKYAVNGESRFANAGTPMVPEALAPVVGGFASLNNFRPRSYAHVLGSAKYDRRTDRATPQWKVASANVLAPGDFAVQYDLNPLYQAGTNGSGQTVAIINESNIDVAQVNRFRDVFGLPVNPPQVVIDGSDPGIDGINNPNPNYASVEAYLDVEWAGAVAPDATIELVIAADTTLESGLFLAAEYAVFNDLAPVVSLSFGQCELYENASNAYLNGLWEQAAAEGITVVVSTGDNGSAGCDDFNTQAYAVEGQAVNGMASTPFNVAVGGTDFYYSKWDVGGTALDDQIATYWDGTRTQSPAVTLLGVIPEQPWNDSQFGLNVTAVSAPFTSIVGGSGGASSAALCSTGAYDKTGACTGTAAGYPKPVWQAGKGVPADGVRDLPDVSLFAATGWNLSFYPICAIDGDCQAATGNYVVQITGVGGTSAAAPAFAGMMALVNQRYGPQGQANFTLYPLAAQYPAAFHDVTVGSNSVPCNIDSITVPAGVFPPKDCIAVANPITGDDPFYGPAAEGQIGTGSTAEYNAGAGYDLASGLGSVDAFQLVTNWGKVTAAGTATTLTASPTTLAHGDAVTVSGTVKGGSGTPTGDVALMTGSAEPGKQSGTFITLNNGAYSGTVSGLPGGTYSIWGRYGGDANDSPSSSPGVEITVTPEDSKLAVTVFNDGAIAVPSGTTGLAYGTSLSLSVTPEPKSHGLTYCSPGQNSGCASFQFPTGTVGFLDNGSAIGTVPVDSKGQAALTPALAFTPGAHSITANYSGDGSYKASTAPAVTFGVDQDTPSIQIGSAQNTYVQGTAPALTVLVESGAHGTAPGGVVLLSGTPLNTPPFGLLTPSVDPLTRTTMGVATVQIPANAAPGVYSIQAMYVPDAASQANYAAANSKTYNLTIEGPAGTIATTMTAKVDSTSTSPAKLVTLSGTVTAASGPAPTGDVFLYVPAGVQNTGSLQLVPVGVTFLQQGAGSSSTFTTVLASQFLFQGTEEITLVYQGNGVDAGSQAFAIVNNSLSDFTLTPEAAVLPVKAGVNATDVIDLVSTNGFSGTVNLSCSAPPGLTCSLSAPAQMLAAGVRAPVRLTVNDASAAAGQTCNVVVTGADATGAIVHTAAVRIFNCAVVSPMKTTPAVGVQPEAATVTTLESLAVAVTVSAGATNALPTGTLTLSGGGYRSAPAELNSGVVNVVIPAGALAVGADTLTGTYVPDATSSTLYNGATGTAQVTVTAPVKAVPGVKVNASSHNITTADPVTVSVNLMEAGGYGTPTGTVMLSSPGYTSAAVELNNGAASIVVAPGKLAVAEDTITAAYTPDGASAATYETATGSTVVTVTGLAAPGFALKNSGNLTLTAGATANNTATITVSPINGFTGSIALACAVSTAMGSPHDPPVCGVTQNVTISGTTAATATLTVTTTASTTAKNVPLGRAGWPGGGVIAALLMLLGLPKRSRRWATMLGLGILLAAMVAVAGMGCGGGSSSSSGGTIAGTTPGNYTVTVTGSAGSTTENTTVTLTVN